MFWCRTSDVSSITGSVSKTPTTHSYNVLSLCTEKNNLCYWIYSVNHSSANSVQKRLVLLSKSKTLMSESVWLLNLRNKNKKCLERHEDRPIFFIFGWTTPSIWLTHWIIRIVHWIIKDPELLERIRIRTTIIKLQTALYKIPAINSVFFHGNKHRMFIFCLLLVVKQIMNAHISDFEELPPPPPDFSEYQNLILFESMLAWK